jgi:hypothetical protein
MSLVEFDGERQHKRRTAVITGQLLTDSPIRVGGKPLDYCLDSALAAARAKLPSAPAFDRPNAGGAVRRGERCRPEAASSGRERARSRRAGAPP